MSTAQSLKIAPAATRHADLLLALEHHKAGRLDHASEIYRRLHSADRHDSEVLFLMGVLCCDLGAFEPACRFLDEALLIAPNFREARAQWVLARNGWADAKITEKRPIDAKKMLDEVAQQIPDDFATWRNLGRVALLQGDSDGAQILFEKSLVLSGENAQTLNLLGLAQLQSERPAAAESSLRRALDLQPNLNQARNNLGLALQRLGNLSESELLFRSALACEPDYHIARINLANTLRLSDRHAAAQLELEAVLAQRPDSVEALNNLSAVFQDLGQAQLALKTLSQALALAPEVPQIRWNLALTQLVLGDFKNGWRNFESRWTGCDSLRGGYKLPASRAWRGESLSGKRILLWAEQGFGDSVQFVRFAKDLASRGASVTVMAQAELAQLFRSAPGVTAVSSIESPVPTYDYHCPLMSLPLQLGIASPESELHGEAPYLSAEPGRVEYWRSRLNSHRNTKVGLAWAGSSRRQSPALAAIDARRSIPIQELTPLLEIQGCTFFSLQKDSDIATTCQKPTGSALLQDYAAEWSDFSDTAAFIANLDLIISVDTAVAHLAGALGKPVWLMNRYDTCWRWLLGRSDSPWYSTLRQFRQPTAGAWQPVVAAVATALQSAAAPR